MPIRSFLESAAAGRLPADTRFAAFVVCSRYWRNNLKVRAEARLEAQRRMDRAA
jgi:hypothetical protein